MATDTNNGSGNLYHERQHFQFCLLHCLNNLLQVFYGLCPLFSYLLCSDSCNLIKNWGVDFAARFSNDKIQAWGGLDAKHFKSIICLLTKCSCWIVVDMSSWSWHITCFHPWATVKYSVEAKGLVSSFPLSFKWLWFLAHSSCSVQGENSFSRNELNSIADGLPTDLEGRNMPNPLSLIFKPHRNAITGNYDANVLISALNSRNKEVVWFDRRNGAETLLTEIADYGDRLLGIIVNISTRKWLGMWQARHWVAIRKLQGVWYNLDSDHTTPVCFVNGEDGLRDYFNSVISSDGVVLFVLNGVSTLSNGSCWRVIWHSRLHRYLFLLRLIAKPSLTLLEAWVRVAETDGCVLFWWNWRWDKLFDSLWSKSSWWVSTSSPVSSSQRSIVEPSTLELRRRDTRHCKSKDELGMWKELE